MLAGQHRPRNSENEVYEDIGVVQKAANADTGLHIWWRGDKFNCIQYVHEVM